MATSGGKADKGRKQQKKKPQHTLKEKRKLKEEKKGKTTTGIGQRDWLAFKVDQAGGEATIFVVGSSRLIHKLRSKEGMRVSHCLPLYLYSIKF